MLVALQGRAGCSVWLDKLQNRCASLLLFDSLYQKYLMTKFFLFIISLSISIQQPQIPPIETAPCLLHFFTQNSV